MNFIPWNIMQQLKRGKQIFMYWYFMMSKIYYFVKSQLQNYDMSQFMF